MLTKDRQDRIINIVNTQRSVTVAELTELLEASEATIRRDLTVLDSQGLIVKVFGGATAVEKDMSAKEDDVPAKSQKNVKEKDIIARYAASIINDEDFVYIDSGTTTLKMIDYIENSKATYVTNGVVHAKKLIEKNMKTIITGGRVRPVTEAVVGPECMESLQKYHFTKAFMGTNGIAAKAGFTTPDVDEAMIKGEAVKHTYMTYVLSDHTKFGLVSAISFAELNKCCIITDCIPENYRSFTVHTVIKELEVKK